MADQSLRFTHVGAMGIGVADKEEEWLRAISRPKELERTVGQVNCLITEMRKLAIILKVVLGAKLRIGPVRLREPLVKPRWLRPKVVEMPFAHKPGVVSIFLQPLSNCGLGCDPGMILAYRLLCNMVVNAVPRGKLAGEETGARRRAHGARGEGVVHFGAGCRQVLQGGRVDLSVAVAA